MASSSLRARVAARTRLARVALRAAAVLAPAASAAQAAHGPPAAYEATPASLARHPVPAWFEDAKLGLFVNWGLYSVPGWAPTSGPVNEVIVNRGWKYWFANNSYAEWYANSMRLDGPTRAYHAKTYGAAFPYDSFAGQFEREARAFDAARWADLFARVHAGYVVLDVKHHDGYKLWPSANRNPRKAAWQSARDFPGELGAAVRRRGMRYGLYYSGGIDWTFNDRTIADIGDLARALPRDSAYAAYVDRDYRELIARYQPDVLWNDIAYPAAANVNRLFADYYAARPEGVVNDRWASAPGQAAHADFTTPEYTTYAEITDRKWEATRGIGQSFGFNRTEDAGSFLSVADLVWTFADVVSKNGNLLLNVGPRADASIQEGQLERLLGLGRWLDTNGDAVFGTRPWVEAEGRTGDSLEVRFTRKPGAVYAIVRGAPRAAELRLTNLHAEPGTTVTLLGGRGALRWRQHGRDLVVAVPARGAAQPAYALRIAPEPWRLVRERRRPAARGAALPGLPGDL
ncbi:MAG: GH29 [uncultured Gemmatimonadaceae bacterium]|uniref:alpha-L-fucosidase n=1 Tax=uncultured Gemmatimonadaceae bacterium TaxID=246130 RepID=A0A6J4K7B6_9BACT|nr:MAG: GH29 [uncultured Gemmatimonadaceae bacterium]